jgi:hypothetical protein
MNIKIKMKIIKENLSKYRMKYLSNRIAIAANHISNQEWIFSHHKTIHLR